LEARRAEPRLLRRPAYHMGISSYICQVPDIKHIEFMEIGLPKFHGWCNDLCLPAVHWPVARRRVAFLPAREEAPVPNYPIFSNGPLVFDPEVTHAMGAAFDEVCRALFVPDKAKTVREAIAEKIIEHARCGERDPDRLRGAVLRHIGVADRLDLSRRSV
jgi:hypothetical protein